MKYLTAVLFVLLNSSLRSSEEKEVKLIDFSSVREILKKDNLATAVEEKKKKEEKKKENVQKKRVQSFNIPGEKDFWNFFSELWIIRNGDVLKWDFESPDYGTEEYFKNFLEEMGKIGVQFKILLINSPNIAHFALPTGGGVHLFILSVPFVRALDISRLQISLLLFEDLMRSEAKIFENFVLDEKLKKLIGSNFYEKEFPKENFNEILSKYDQFILERGFSFKQQFQITKMVDKALKSKPKHWNAYREMIEKKDNLVKSNISFKRYSKIYPSPELQMNWLVSLKEDI